MPDSVHKKITYIGHGFLVLLLFFSLYFCNERMLHTDNAYCSFLLLNTQEFIFSHNRYPLVLTQVLPLLAIKFNLSVQSVIAAYSVNFYLVYYGCFLLCLYAFKNIKAAIIIVFGLLIACKEIFFLQTEVYHGLVFACLFYAWYNVNSSQIIGGIKKTFHLLVGAIIFVIAVTFHPLAALFLMVLIGWDIVEKKKHKEVSGYAIILTVLIGSILKAKYTPADSYEGAFYKQTGTFFDTLLHLPASYTLRFFLIRLIDVYAIPAIMILFGLFWLIVKMKQHLLAAYISAAILAYLVLVAVVFKGDSDIMMERVFLVFGFIASLVFVHVLLYAFQQQYSSKWQSALLLFMVSVLTGGALFILKGANRYEERLAIVSKQAAALQQQQGSKFYSTNDKFPYPYSFWSNACEQLLISAMRYPQHIKTLYIFNNTNEAASILGTNEDDQVFLLVPFYLKLDNSYLNKKYFNLSTGVYAPANL